jgi:hypothetical protein
MSDFKQSSPKPKPFFCSAAYHLQTSGLCLAIYDVIGAVTYSSGGIYFTSQKRMSDYLMRDYSSVRKAFGMLRQLGWLEWDDVLEGGATDIKKFRYISHKVWEKNPENAAKCCKREMMPWQDQQTDPLVGQLWAAAGSKLRVYEYQVSKLRELAEGDDTRVLTMFQTELAQAKVSRAAGHHGGTSPKSCLYRVGEALRNKRKTG